MRVHILAAVLFAAALANSAGAQKFVVDEPASNRLTDYLHSIRFPLVGAEVADAGDGMRRVVLYGFVATDSDSINAGQRALEFLDDPNYILINRIKVDPSLADSPVVELPAAAQPPAVEAPDVPPTESPKPDQWNRIMDEIYREGAPSPPDEGAPAVP
jgi:hypothetical protein